MLDMLARADIRDPAIVDAYIKQQWAQIGSNPAANRLFNSLMFLRLRDITISPGGRPQNEIQFASSFREYVIQSNTHMAELALQAYYEWKSVPKPAPPGLAVLFHFGDVPIDFQAKVSESVNAGVAAAGLAASTAMITGATLAQTSAVAAGQVAAYAGAAAIQTSLATGVPLASNATATAAANAAAAISSAGGAAAAGAIVGAALIFAVSLDRVLQIATAEDKLKEAVQKAKAGANLNLTYDHMLVKWLLATGNDLSSSAEIDIRAVAPQSGTLEQLLPNPLSINAADGAQANEFLKLAWMAGKKVQTVGWQNLNDYDCVRGLTGVKCTSKKDGSVKTSADYQPDPNAPVTLGAVGMPQNMGMVDLVVIPSLLEQVPGVADDIGVGKDGSVWKTSDNDYIYRRVNNEWRQIGGQGVRISVGPDGNAWLVNRTGYIFRYDGSKWLEIPGTGQDVGVGADGTVWITGANDYIYRRESNYWRQIGGQGVRIAVAPDGNPWLVNRAGQIFRYDGSKWLDMPGQATDIGVGPDGRVWCANATGIHLWRNGTWQEAKRTGENIAIAGAPNGQAWVITKDRQTHILK
jgi:hypothetical protein